MITCRELVGFIASYLDMELPEAQRDQFERHLRACPACVAYLETYKASIELARRASAAGTAEPAAMPEELVKAILDAQRS